MRASFATLVLQMTHLDVLISGRWRTQVFALETASKCPSAPLKRAKRPNPKSLELFRLETVMHDDTVRVDDAFGVPLKAARGTDALENPPAAAADMPYADLVTLGGSAASSSSPSCAATASARCRTDPYGETIDQEAQLASWEDEGGPASG